MCGGVDWVCRARGLLDVVCVCVVCLWECVCVCVWYVACGVWVGMCVCVGVTCGVRVCVWSVRMKACVTIFASRLLSP